MNVRGVRLVLVAMALLFALVIVWIDLATDVWQKYVVMAGLASGVVTFILFALVVDRLIARSIHERWAPVTRLALGELRRSLTADDSHRMGTGKPAARRLPDPGGSPDALSQIIARATAERDELTHVLARWSSFLASSADVTDIMDSVAEIAERLDRIDTLTAETSRASGATGAGGPLTASQVRELREEIDSYHRSADLLLARIDDTLERVTGPGGPPA